MLFKPYKLLFLLFFFVLNSLPVLSQDFRFKDLKYPYKTEKIKIRSEDIEMAYIDEGKGNEAVLFIHGLGSYLPVWKKNIDSLSKKYLCVALDLPGYGKSSKAAAYEYNMSFYAQSVLKLIEKLKLDKVTLVGHSMGGQIAMTVALLQPEKIKKLILIAPAGFEEFTEEQAELLKSFTTAQYVKNTTDDKIKTNLAANFYKMPEDANFMVADRIEMKKAKDFDAYCNAVSKSVAGMLEEPVFKKLEQIQQPTLIIFGENDTLIPNKYFNPKLSTDKIAQAGKEKLKNSNLVIIKEAGHLVQFEKAKECNEAILKFLNE